ncbi:hypothetical protein B6U99_06280 [Candidatus Geothermarchaeota archaeon ex4572_27]|nr:MAG: hypothetical protein B6U99_06280 [Candidatus Geothermarchaeota archaeon ex4572_27]
MTLVVKKIDEGLVREFKAEAVRRGLTLSEALAEAISLWLQHVRSEGVVETEDTVNNRVYESMKAELERRYSGKYVVISGGRLIGAYESGEEVIAALRKIRPRHAIVVRVGERPGVGEWLGGSLEL